MSVEITQADIVAASEVERASWLPDDHPTVIAFAKHRSTSTEEVERLRTAIEQALKCTPSIEYAHTAEATIIYDCGDPWEILRTALGATSHVE